MNSKIFIEGSLFNVLFLNELDRLAEAMIKFEKVAISDGQWVYPIRRSPGPCGTPGAYYMDGLPALRFVAPTDESEANVMYKSENIAYLDGNSMAELMAEQAKLAKAESAILTSANPENIFKPNIDQINDSPLMFALKTAVAEKCIDINKYADRFGTDFNNDRRKFNSNKISIDKFSSIASKLDMKATLILEDADPKPGEDTVPNPIGHSITIQLFPVEGEDYDT